MEDKQEKKQQVINELVELRQRVTKLEASEAERKRAEESLRESEEYVRAIFESSTDGIAVVNEKGNFVDFNKAFADMLGYTREELKKLSYDELTPKEFAYLDEKAFKQALERGYYDEFEKEYIRKDGARVPVIVSGGIIGGKPERPRWKAFALVKDITERREMEERLVRSEKLAVLGQLAGGVGHELRNPLGAIKNAAYFLNMALEEPEPEVKETLEILEKEVATSERIISDLLDFARPKPPIRREVNINDVIHEALSRSTMPEDVEVVSQLDEALPTILADPDQLAQVLGNIILNAIQAMPEGGRLVVKSEVLNSEWVTVSLADTGVGIPAENLARLFEPLFTTKARGIGFGLAVVKALVEGHGGTIEVQSEVEKGSTFTIRLPIGRGEKE